MIVAKAGYYKFNEEVAVPWNDKYPGSRTTYIKDAVIYIAEEMIDCDKEIIQFSPNVIAVSWHLPVTRMVEEDQTPQYLFYDYDRKACFEHALSLYEADPQHWQAAFKRLSRDLCRLQQLNHALQAEKDYTEKSNIGKDIRTLYVSMLGHIYAAGYTQRINIDDDVRQIMRNSDWSLFDNADDAGEEIQRQQLRDFEEGKAFREMEIRQSADDFYSIHYSHTDYPFEDKLVVHPDFKPNKLNPVGDGQGFFWDYNLTTHIVETY